MVRRYLLTFTLLIVVPIFVLLLVFSRMLEKTLIENLSAQSLETTQQVAQSLDQEAKQLAILTAALATNDELLNRLAEYAAAATPAQTLVISRQITAQLDPLFLYINQSGGIFFFFTNKDVLYHRNIPISLSTEVKQHDWYRQFLNTPGRTAILPTFSLHSEYHGLFLSCAISLEKQTRVPELEMIVVSFKSHMSRKLLSTIVPNPSQEETGSLLITNADNEVIFDRDSILSSNPTLPILSSSDGWHTITSEAGTYLLNASSMPYTQMRVLKLFDYTALTASVRKYAWYVRGTMLVLTLLFGVYTAVFFRGIVGPLHDVVHNMKQVGKGDMTVRVEAGGIAELRALSETFNRMVTKIGELTEQIEQKERQRAQSEIDALQFQINPHFLSNTLNAIKMMATLVRAENIRKMTGALMTILSASFRDTHAVALLEEQLNNLESYVYIMKVRFGDSFDVVFDIEDSVKRMPVLKMLLQPILENSILHGIRELDRKGRIEVRAWQDDRCLYLKVSDNGVGMSNDTLDAVWGKVEHMHKGLNCIGIRNVHERIRLNYGDDYGLHIQSALAQGTQVTFVLPILTERDHV